MQIRFIVVVLLNIKEESLIENGCNAVGKKMRGILHFYIFVKNERAWSPAFHIDANIGILFDTNIGIGILFDIIKTELEMINCF